MFIRGHPERTSQVRGEGGLSALKGQSKATFIVTMMSGGDRGGRGSKSPDFEVTSFMDGPS